MMIDFKDKYTLKERKEESLKIRKKYPDRIPIIVKIGPNMILDKNKYIVPKDLSIGQFIYVLRKRMKLPPEKAVFIFINGVLPPTSSFIEQIYNKYMEDDGFLYMYFCGENTFGYFLLY